MDNSNNKGRRKPRRRFSNEFKEEAVKLSQKIGVKETAKKLGIHTPNLSAWRKKILNPKAPKSKDGPSYEELLKENKRLKQELDWVNDINEVLKKSTAIFSNERMGKKK